MRKCCGCQGGAAEESREAVFDLALLEASERSLKFSFCAPRASTRLPSSSSSAIRVGRGPLNFVFSILGGPYSDIRGPRQENVQGVSCSSRVVHEVKDLQPETEYTINVSLVGAVGGQRLLEETLEARTASASTALFAEEDWGRPSKAKDGFKEGDFMSDPKSSGKQVNESSGGSLSSTAPGISSASAAAVDVVSRVGAQAGRADSQDDVSTIAPSEAGEETCRRNSDDHGSESGSEAGMLSRESTAHGPQASASSGAQDPASSSATREAAALPPLEEGPLEDGDGMVEVTVVEATPSRAADCKLCSMLDCLKISGNRSSSVQPDDIVIERQVAKAAPKPVRKFRPYRPVFPGTPVDPRSVGLFPGPGDLV